jgi:hypothetical protein
MKNALDTARDCLSRLPAAISGQGGHPATFRAACECIRLGLGDGDAMLALDEFNRRCSPPWSEKELRHKLADARKAAGGQVRRYTQPAPAVRVAWIAPPRRTPMAPAPSSAPAPEPAPEPAPSTITTVELGDMEQDGDPHLAGWHRSGKPIYQGTVREWRERFKAACRKHGGSHGRR